MTGPDPREGFGVVRFVEALDPGARPPELPLPRRLGSFGRAVLAVVFAVASAGAGLAAVELWTMPTPGVWFSVLFTVLLSGLVAAAWFAYATAFARARREREAAVRWLDEVDRLEARTARITERFVNLGDDGDVAAFEIDVAMEPSGTPRASASWEPLAGLRKLLQPQLPGIGAEVLVWRAPGSPRFVVDVLDPTRVEG